MSQDKEKTISPSAQETNASGAREASSQSLSALQNRLQRKRETEADILVKDVIAEYAKLRKDLLDTMRSEGDSIKSDIKGLHQQFRKGLRLSYWIGSFGSVMILVSCAIGLWAWGEMQTRRVINASETLERVQATIAAEKEHLSGVDWTLDNGTIWFRVPSQKPEVFTSPDRDGYFTKGMAIEEK